MLQRFRYLINATSHVPGRCESRLLSPSDTPLESVKCIFPSFNQRNPLHTSLPRMKDKLSEMRRRDVQAKNKVLGVTEGVGQIGLDNFAAADSLVFPTVDLPTTLFDGVPFKDIPIVHVKASKNNTVLHLTEKNVIKLNGSCGLEGFKNTKKGTNIAAQAAGQSFAHRAVKRGYKNVRILVTGLGPGRLNALRGMQLGGLKIISITDRSKDETCLRPKKQRRL